MTRPSRPATPTRATRLVHDRPGPAVQASSSLLPPPRAWLDPRGPVLVPLLLLALSRAVYAWRIPLAAEDAYITFRFARNLATGHGLVFNAGQRVMGFTSPLWTIWTAFGIRLGADPLIWTRLWSALADGVTLVLVATMLARTISVTSARVFGVFFALWPYFSAVSVSGMETGPMVCLLVLSAALLERGSRLGGPALAALALTRPEGFAAACLLALGARPRDRVVAMAITAVGLGALYAYFGSVLPQSVLAKARIYGTPGPWAGRHWWDWFVPTPLGRAPVTIEGTHLFVFSAIFSPSVVVGARALWAHRKAALARVAAAAILVWLGYSVLGVAYFYWYLVLPLCGLLILASIGFPRIVRGPGIYVSGLIFVVGLWYSAQTLYIGRAQYEYFGFGGVAKYLGTHGEPGQKVMLEPIGMVGYFTDLTVVDEIGLVSPEVARRRLTGPGWYADIARAQRPDWLVLRGMMITKGEALAGTGAPFRSAEERTSVLSSYRPVARFGEPGDQSIEVLRRQP